MSKQGDITPLKVALIHRNSPRLMHQRSVGWWSYDTPEFVVKHIPVNKGFYVSQHQTEGADVIIYEDGKIYGVIEKPCAPVLYHIVDSTLSENHYRSRLTEARKNADLILVDWDRLKRFESVGVPVVRFSYCVNDERYHPRRSNYSKRYDIGWHWGKTPERIDLSAYLVQHSQRKFFTYTFGPRSGIQYAEALAESRVILNLARNPQTRSHRILDTMASGTCLVSDPFPEVETEMFRDGEHYLRFTTFEELAAQLDRALEDGEYRDIAANALQLIRERHTWAVRSKELRENIKTYLGI